MAALTDRLDGLVGAKAAARLEEVLGIRTVDDLLRHYPRKYSDGRRVLGEDDLPEAGEHITLVGVIGRAELKRAQRNPARGHPAHVGTPWTRRTAAVQSRPRPTAAPRGDHRPGRNLGRQRRPRRQR